MADPYGNYQANLGLLSGPGLNPKGIDPELLRQITGILSAPGPAVGLGIGTLPTASNLADAATLPGDVTTGKADLNTPEGFGRAMNMTGTLTTGGMPMAEAGAAGIFGGKLAKTADLEALQTAKDMAGKSSPEDIWNKTGWFQGPDQQWRFEIPDNKSAIADKLGNKGGYEGPMQGLLSHADLYEAYPWLKNINTTAWYDRSLRAPVEGQYSSSINTRYGGSGTPADVHSMLLHELQHAVQDTEGFAPGTAPKPGEYENYLSSPGEVEARKVQARMKLPENQLKSLFPWLP